MFVFFTCAFICRLGTYLLPGKPYSSKGPDGSAKKGRINPYLVRVIFMLLLHVFPKNPSNILMKTVKVKIKKDPLFKNIKTHKVLPIFNDLI